MSTVEFENNAKTAYGYQELPNRRCYRLNLAIVHEEDKSYSAIVLNLPGAGSCGETESESIENAKEAAVGVIHSYHEEGKQIPWNNDYNDRIPEGAVIRRVLVQLDA